MKELLYMKVYFDFRDRDGVTINSNDILINEKTNESIIVTDKDDLNMLRSKEVFLNTFKLIDYVLA